MQEVLSHSQKILQERGDDIRFVRAVEDGSPCWFYLKLDPSKKLEYQKNLKSGDMNIRDYGTIMESDWGDYPPRDVVLFMKQEHGFKTPELES